MEGAEERLLFHEYLIKKFGNAVNEVSAKRSLGYELEYILSGCASDRENLEAVVKKLLGIRFGINYLYLQTDTAKQAEAEALAPESFDACSASGCIRNCETGALAAWAFGESLMDLRSLMAGKKAALVKNSTNWQLSLSSLMTLGTGRICRRARMPREGSPIPITSESFFF